MGVEGHACDRQTRQRYGISDQADDNSDYSRVQEQPTRTVGEIETQRPPSVSKSLEVWRMRLPSVRPQRDGNFDDIGVVYSRLDNHLRSKFHARAPLVEPVIKLPRKSTQSTIDVIKRRGKHSPDKN